MRSSLFSPGEGREGVVMFMMMFMMRMLSGGDRWCSEGRWPGGPVYPLGGPGIAAGAPPGSSWPGRGTLPGIQGWIPEWSLLAARAETKRRDGEYNNSQLIFRSETHKHSGKEHRNMCYMCRLESPLAYGSLCFRPV